jgi:peptide/nickel transport system ATP-binding protein
MSEPAANTPVLEVSGLRKSFASRRSRAAAHAVRGVDLRIERGEILGLVGESGSGKSTLARCLVRLLEPDAGAIRLHGTDITHLRGRALRPLRRQVHMVFQDPYSSLNPRLTVRQSVAEPLRAHGLTDRRRVAGDVADLLSAVGLDPALGDRYPHELSGGQRQRVGLARSLGLRPSLLVADEPVSALDVSVRAAILNQLLDLRAQFGFSCLFVAHDLGTVEFLCDRVAVMYAGEIVEQGACRDVFTAAGHPYTQALLAAVPVPDPVVAREQGRLTLAGDPPSPHQVPAGCAFHTRCPAVLARCATEPPPVVARPDGRLTRCHLAARGDGADPEARRVHRPS